MKKKGNILDFIIRRSILRLKGALIMFCIGIIIFIGMGIITYEPPIKHTNSDLYPLLQKYLQGRKDNLELLSEKLMDISPVIAFGISEHSYRDFNEMRLIYNWSPTDTFQCKKELFEMYEECFNVKPEKEIGPDIISEKGIVKVYKHFGYNLCERSLKLHYTKLDTTELKSRYPSLPYYPKESQPKDSECTYIWELDDNWYIIAN